MSFVFIVLWLFHTNRRYDVKILICKFEVPVSTCKCYRLYLGLYCADVLLLCSLWHHVTCGQRVMRPCSITSMDMSVLPPPKSVCAPSCDGLVAAMRWKCSWVLLGFAVRSGFHFDHMNGDHRTTGFRKQMLGYESSLFRLTACFLPASEGPWGESLVGGRLQAEWVRQYCTCSP